MRHLFIRIKPNITVRQKCVGGVVGWLVVSRSKGTLSISLTPGPSDSQDGPSKWKVPFLGQGLDPNTSRFEGAERCYDLNLISLDRSHRCVTSST